MSILVICFFTLFFIAGLSKDAYSSLPSGVKIIAEYSIQGKVLDAIWSSLGDSIIFSSIQKRKASLNRYRLKTKRLESIARGKNTFWPSLGPMGTLIAGPRYDPPLPKKLKKTNKKRSWLAWRGGKGLVLYSHHERSFLFPGFQPRYSSRARRLVFSYRGILYLWNPLQSRRKGLMLLTKGYQPQWSSNGRSLAFLRNPFDVIDGKIKGSGGLQIVDMLFRVARLTKTGGQTVWFPDQRNLAYVDFLNPLKKGLKKRTQNRQIGIYRFSLAKGTKRKQLLFPNSWAPTLLANSGFKEAEFIAFTNKQGVWLAHLKTKKSILLVLGAKIALWSPKGDLLVIAPKLLRVFRFSPKFLGRLSR